MDKQQTQEHEKLISTVISSKVDAIEVMIGFLAFAQRKGVFSLREAGKILECINKMTDTSPPLPEQNISVNND
jgi:hypothetical protein